MSLSQHIPSVSCVSPLCVPLWVGMDTAFPSLLIGVLHAFLQSAHQPADFTCSSPIFPLIVVSAAVADSHSHATWTSHFVNLLFPRFPMLTLAVFPCAKGSLYSRLTSCLLANLPLRFYFTRASHALTLASLQSSGALAASVISLPLLQAPDIVPHLYLPALERALHLNPTLLKVQTYNRNNILKVWK